MKKQFKTVFVMLMAMTLALSSISVNVEAKSKSKIKYGEANVDQRLYPDVGLDESNVVFVHPPFFNARVKVKLDKNGKVVYVKDDDTGKKSLRPNDPLKDYWSMVHGGLWNGGYVTHIGTYKGGAQYILPMFKGKNLAQIKRMKFKKRTLIGEDGKVHKQIDIVAYALKEAVINALEGKKGKGFLTYKQTLKPVKEVEQGSTEVKFVNTLPKGYNVKLLSLVHGAQNQSDIAKAVKGVSISKDGKTMKVPSTLKPGHYYVNIFDGNKKYRSPDFDREGELPAHYPYFVVKNNAKISLEGDQLKVDGDDLENIIKNIKSIKITEKDSKEFIKNFEAVSTTHGFKKNDIVNFLGKEGKINHNLNIFENNKSYEIQIDVWGMETQTFSYKNSGLSAAQSAKAVLRKYMDTMNPRVLKDPAIATESNKAALAELEKEIEKARGLLKKLAEEISKDELDAIKAMPTYKDDKGKKIKGSINKLVGKVLVDYGVVGDRTEKSNAPKNSKLYTVVDKNNGVIEIKTCAAGLKKEGARRLYLNYVTGKQYNDSAVDTSTSATPKYAKQEMKPESYDVVELKDKNGKTTGYKITIKEWPEDIVIVKPIIKIDIFSMTHFENGDMVFVK